MKTTHDYYLIVDLEATCCDRGKIPRTRMEIIEIGAVLQNSRTLEIEQEFQTFVKPVRTPLLTEFCTQLTTIQQADVDAAPGFAEAIARFKEFFEAADVLFSSWGNYDKAQFEQDCRHHSVPYPFGREHMNLKAEFSRSLQLPGRYGLSSALNKLGLSFEGTAHRGIDDVRNIARIVRQVVGMLDSGKVNGDGRPD